MCPALPAVPYKAEINLWEDAAYKLHIPEVAIVYICCQSMGIFLNGGKGTFGRLNESHSRRKNGTMRQFSSGVSGKSCDEVSGRNQEGNIWVGKEPSSQQNLKLF